MPTKQSSTGMEYTRLTPAFSKLSKIWSESRAGFVPQKRSEIGSDIRDGLIPPKQSPIGSDI